MSECTGIFPGPISTPCNTIPMALRILSGHWNVLISISAERAACLFGVSLIFALLTALFGMDDLVSIADALSASATSNNAHARAAARTLRAYRTAVGTDIGSDVDAVDADVDADVADVTTDVADVSSVDVGAGFLLSCAIFLAAVSFVDAAYRGATVHVVAKAHTGHPPLVTLDRNRTAHVFLYRSLGCAAALALRCTLGLLPPLVATPRPLSLLFGLLYPSLCVFAACAMVGAVPAIVVERRGPLDAVRRSWGLCARHTPFIFGSYACFVVSEVGAGILFFVMFMGFDGGLVHLLRCLVPLLATVVLFPLGIILEVILYLNIRVQSEGLDLPTLEQELLLDPIIVDAMESQPLLLAQIA